MRPLRELLTPEFRAPCEIELYPWGIAQGTHSTAPVMSALRGKFLTSWFHKCFWGDGRY
jgi:hypothetical protein